MAKLSHIAIQCNRIEETLKSLVSQWSPLGIDTWKTIDYQPEGEELLSGETFKIQSSLTMLTKDIEMNVLDSVASGTWFAQQYHKWRGDAIEHIAWAVDDFDGMIEKFEKIGFHNVACADYMGNRWVQLRNIWSPGGWGIELLEAGMHGPIINMLSEKKADAVQGTDDNICHLSQIGTLVYDLDKTMEALTPAFELLEIGPFKAESFAPMKDAMIVGNPFKMKSMRAKAASNIDYIFSEMIEGNNELFEYLNNKHEGVAYMGFTVSDYESITSTIEENGYKIFASGSNEGKRWAYFDTGNEPGGVILKILEAGIKDV